MSTEYSEQELALREQVEHTRDELAQCTGALREADAQLESLAHEGRRYDALSQACRSLEELDALDAAALFWGPQADAAAGCLRDARAKVDAFVQRLDAAKAQRQAIIDRIESQNLELEDLHYDLQCAIDQEERRRNNWVIEREAQPLPYRHQVMPWSRGCEEDRRFQRSLGTSVMASLALGVLISTVALPVLERPPTPEVPERVARLVREARPLPPPPPVEAPVLELPVVEETPPPPKPEPEPEPKLAQTPALQAASEQQVATAAPSSAPPPRQAAPTGLLAFRESIADRAKTRPSARLGAGARLSSAGESAVARTQRSMVATSAPGSSGGINLAELSRDVGAGGPGLGGVEVSRVASAIGGGNSPDRPLSAGASAGRTDEEIQIVFDRYKAALYRLYNRELRRDPTLRGQLVLRLTIEPDGSVSLVQLHSSSMNAPDLSQQIVDRVQGFDFGAKPDIAAMTIIYPIDFLPAA